MYQKKDGGVHGARKVSGAAALWCRRRTDHASERLLTSASTSDMSDRRRSMKVDAATAAAAIVGDSSECRSVDELRSDIGDMRDDKPLTAVSYTHLTLPTILRV